MKHDRLNRDISEMASLKMQNTLMSLK